jgi:sarcosine oxidase subunit gamma
VSNPQAQLQRRDLQRFGCKGPRAAAWLQQQNVAVPERVNSWGSLYGDVELSIDIVVRLGASEFLIEHAAEHQLARELSARLCQPIAGVYPVLREDSAFELRGGAADAVLAQVCNVNFSELVVHERPAVMTMMIGVAVTVVPQGTGAQRRYRIWCDPSFGDYLESSLRDVVGNVSGE